MNNPGTSSKGIPKTISSICPSLSSYEIISKSGHFCNVISAKTACGPPRIVKISELTSLTAVAASNAGFAKGVNALKPTRSGLCFFTAIFTS